MIDSIFRGISTVASSCINSCKKGTNTQVKKSDEHTKAKEHPTGFIQADSLKSAVNSLSVVTAPLQALTGGIGIVTGAISGYILKLTSVFSPFVDFVNSACPTQETEGNRCEKKTVKDLTTVLKGVQAQINADKELHNQLSPESRERLFRLFDTVSELSKREDLKNLDITQLIANWRQHRSTRALLHLSQRLRNGQCARFREERLRETFIDSLESLAQALEEIRSHPPSENRDQAEQEITSAADHTVNAVERHNERGGDENFTPEDRQYVGHELRETSRHVGNVIHNPTLSNFVQSCYSGLCSLVSSIHDFLTSWLDDFFEEQEVREKEKQCEERKEAKKEFHKLCNRHKIARRKAEIFREMMIEAKKKLLHFLKIRDEEKCKSQRNERKYNHAYLQVDKFSVIHGELKNNYKLHGNREDFYKAKDDEVLSDMPPSTVCDPSGTNLEFDLIC